MRDVSSVNPAGRVAAPHVAAPARRGFIVPSRTRVLMVVFGFIPFLHLLTSAAPVALAASGSTSWRAAWLALVVLFVVPPLAVRIATVHRPLPTGSLDPSSAGFLRWWFTAQCQVLFSRLSFLEEALRLVPGLYSVWLRLWGARVGSLVYWSPGVTILDRSLLHVGDRVVFGAGVRLNPHVLAPGRSGAIMLHLGAISIGSDALIGGYSILLPGCEIANGEVTRPFRSVHAFSKVAHGRRVRLDHQGTDARMAGSDD